MALTSRMSSRARLVVGCRCERPLPEQNPYDTRETSCVKCGHQLDPRTNRAQPKRTGRHNGRQR